MREKVNRAAPTRPKPFGVLIFDNWSERGRLRKRRRPQTSKEAASLLGCAIGVRYASEISPSRRLPRSGLNAGCAPILQPQSYTGERKAYVLFVFFVAKNKPTRLRIFDASAR